MIFRMSRQDSGSNSSNSISIQKLQFFLRNLFQHDSQDLDVEIPRIIIFKSVEIDDFIKGLRKNNVEVILCNDKSFFLLRFIKLWLKLKKINYDNDINNVYSFLMTVFFCSSSTRAWSLFILAGLNMPLS